ncbi:MAG: hypothetical protein DME72_04700 [Verrucomicrobia bacterium]|nr:MAG: hypothetical protein DME72_04700 [Verrucomicrobiota bacterium]
MSRIASLRAQPTKQSRCKSSHHIFKKSESSQKTEARKIEEDSRHLGPIIARAAKIASGTNGGQSSFMCYRF